MNNKFDALAKGMAQSVTRRAALKKFGVGLAGMALACFGLANKAQAATCVEVCIANHCKGFPVNSLGYRGCLHTCAFACHVTRF